MIRIDIISFLIVVTSSMTFCGTKACDNASAARSLFGSGKCNAYCLYAGEAACTSWRSWCYDNLKSGVIIGLNFEEQPASEGTSCDNFRSSLWQLKE